jgi:small multidrug resistance pump
LPTKANKENRICIAGGTNVPALNLTTTLSFAGSIALQVFALGRLPLTRGFADLPQTLIVLVVFAAGIALLARIQASGVPLSILIPLSAAAVPLALIVTGLVIYHEPASPLKVVLLVATCGIIGIASRL